MAKFFKSVKETLVQAFKYMTRTTCDDCKKTCESEVLECKTCNLRVCDKCYESHEQHNFLDDDDEESSDNDDDDQQTCNICKTSGPEGFLSSFCRNCHEDMCDRCVTEHRSNAETQHHRILTETASSSMTQHSSSDRSNREEAKNNKEVTPGKPKIWGIKSESIRIQWRRPYKMTKTDYYQLWYKGEGSSSTWTYWGENIMENKTRLFGLRSNSKYTFRVRVVHEGDEWPYSKQSGMIKTNESMAEKMVGQSKLTKQGTPSVYSLPAKEDNDARNTEKKTKKYELGTKDTNFNTRWKTIMLVGATGTGKTTLVDGIVNYVLGVNWDDPHRFTIVELENDERSKLDNQAISQTEWITCYTIYSSKNGGRLDFTLTIVDTPGFGDTRGISQDKKVIDQIKHLFSQQGPKGILALDAICFLNKAPDARLTPQQKYVFQQILSMFGKDVEENICSLITFADGQEPPVLHSLREAELLFNKDFCFNNSALFASNDPKTSSNLSQIFWNMGHESFRKFFSHIQKLQSRSLEMTRNVLRERETLENTIENIQLQVSRGLLTISSLRDQIHIFRQHKTDAEANKDFEYEIKHSVKTERPLPAGEYVTNCLHCHHTCHYPCYVKLDLFKRVCAAMDWSGNCNVCKHKCLWSRHKIMSHIIDTEIVVKKEKYSEKMKKFEKAKKGMVTHEEAIGLLKEQMEKKMLDVQEKMTTVKRCNERLEEIALQPNSLSMVEYIDIMIAGESLEQSDGYRERIKELKFYRERANTSKKAEDFLAIKLDEELNI